MSLLLIAIGVVLFLSGIRGTTGQLASQLRQDFTGANSFLYWCATCIVIGLLGGIGGPWRTASRTFLALVVIAFVLANRGIVANFQTAIASPPAPDAADPGQQPGAATGPQNNARTAPGATGSGQGGTPSTGAGIGGAGSGSAGSGFTFPDFGGSPNAGTDPGAGFNLSDAAMTSTTATGGAGSTGFDFSSIGALA